MILLLGLTLVGAATAVELTVIYHRSNSDLGHRSHCAMQGEWDCDDVARSKYAVVLGVPVALWGILGYGVMAMFAGWGLARRAPAHFPLGVLALLVFFSLGMSGYLAWVSMVILKKKCQYCTVLYGVNGALALGLVWAFVSRRVSPIAALREDFSYLLDRLRASLVVACTVLAATAVAFVIGPQLGKAKQLPRPREASELIKRPAAHQEGPKTSGDRHSPLPPLPRGEPEWVRKLVAPHTPSKGPKDADLYIVEFSDYECPFCQLSNGMMEKVLAKHGARIRLYHRHFPLDTACFKRMRRQMHPHACFAASAAICAHQQGKFWLFHDAQFRLGRGIDRASIRGLARATGLGEEPFERCLKSADTARIIQEDIQAAVGLKLQGTPAFIMGGPLIDQFQPEGLSVEMFDKLFEALDQAKRDYEARRAGGAPAPGSVSGPPSGPERRSPPEAMAPRE
ncbi:MAG: vitamin K epoxide reductase family protein [Polyangia bacterium]|jgi:protein-disulfide isomerase/uncharacterized membrane protein|nr:vitamin K epoxide reductase family protein [Polyangia bacterium]